MKSIYKGTKYRNVSAVLPSNKKQAAGSLFLSIKYIYLITLDNWTRI
jgi:hypothetical protein